MITKKLIKVLLHNVIPYPVFTNSSKIKKSAYYAVNLSLNTVNAGSLPKSSPKNTASSFMRSSVICALLISIFSVNFPEKPQKVLTKMGFKIHIYRGVFFALPES
jgi:hypothetical protein